MLTKKEIKKTVAEVKKTRYISYYNEESHFDPHQYNMTSLREIFESYTDYCKSRSWE